MSNSLSTTQAVLPGIIIHADWSKSAQKRWLAKAVLQLDGTFFLQAPEQVYRAADLLAELFTHPLDERPVLVGFDFPIGLPYAYAQKAGIQDYLTFLKDSTTAKWADFYRVATCPEEISLSRPFYPQKPGSARQAHLVQALECKHIDELRRRCEQAHPHRRAAAPLFWTMGAQQVGKAALSGWQEILIPALEMEHACIWPFSGALDQLLASRNIIFTETYPAEFYTQLGLDFSPQMVKKVSPQLTSFSKTLPNRFGKRSQAQRYANAPHLLNHAEKSGLVLSEHLENMMKEGFGAQATAEDAFDAVVGLLGMIATLHTWQIGDDPARFTSQPGHWINVEGWIFGQKFLL